MAGELPGSSAQKELTTIWNLYTPQEVSNLDIISQVALGFIAFTIGNEFRQAHRVVDSYYQQQQLG